MKTIFYPETLDFIAENAFMNSKVWFEEHKDKYKKYVQEPLVALSQYVAPAVEDIDPHIITLPRNTVSRIYRDARFAKGSLYRDMLWVSFRRDKKCFQAWPEFYFIISPGTFFYGCGYYCTKTPVMAEIRKMVASDHPMYIRARDVLMANEEIVIDGEMYKRSRYPHYSEDKRIWLDRKTIRFTVFPSGKQLFSPDLAEQVRQTFLAMRPIYDLLVYAEEQAVLAEEDTNKQQFFDKL